jgi:hypothetical protein
MKAKKRKEQREKEKEKEREREREKSIFSNLQSSENENKSQDFESQIDINKKKPRYRNMSAEMPKGYFEDNVIPKYKSKIISNNNLLFIPNRKFESKKINKENYKELELSRIATMFNFEVDKEKDIITIKENDEYYDMRNQIIELQKELEKSQRDYNNLINDYEKKNERDRQLIGQLENELKKNVDNDIEKVKKDNILLVREINILDKKATSINAQFKKDEYEMNHTIIELDKIIKKLKGEIIFVDDLKMRLKNLTNKDIPQELVDTINFVLKEDIADKYKHTPSHSNIASVRSRTGTIPIADILDTSSIDSKKSAKKLYV